MFYGIISGHVWAVKNWKRHIVSQQNDARDHNVKLDLLLNGVDSFSHMLSAYLTAFNVSWWLYNSPFSVDFSSHLCHCAQESNLTGQRYISMEPEGSIYQWNQKVTHFLKYRK